MERISNKNVKVFHIFSSMRFFFVISQKKVSNSREVPTSLCNRHDSVQGPLLLSSMWRNFQPFSSVWLNFTSQRALQYYHQSHTAKSAKKNSNSVGIMFSSICMYTVHSNKQAWIQDLLWNPDQFLGFATFWWDPDHFYAIRIIFVGSGSVCGIRLRNFFHRPIRILTFLFKIIYFDTGHGLTKIIFYSYTVNLKLDKSETWRTFFFESEE